MTRGTLNWQLDLRTSHVGLDPHPPLSYSPVNESGSRFLQVKKTTRRQGLAPGQFGPFDGRVWLNTAHQGPMPRAAVEAAGTAAEMKAAPHRVLDSAFTDVPERLRSLLAQLVGGDPEQVVLGNSTSHGLHLVANGLSMRPGDQVLLIDGDYPATVLPWLRLADRGVEARWLRPRSGTLSDDELAAALTSRTRVLALTWVDSFTGHAADLHALGRVCRSAGVLFVVNAAQAIGARSFDVATTPVDAVVGCGYKWLCGPYGTGFTWVSADLLAQLHPQQAYWLAMQAGRGLDQMRDRTLRDDLGVRGFDVFCPANFLDVLPWIAAVELILETGVDVIAAHDQLLVDQVLAGLDPEQYKLISPAEGSRRSTLVVLDRIDGTAKQRHGQLTAAGIDIALREDKMRLSPHLFNTPEDISRALEMLHTSAPAGT
jgi:cysteine desulfurase/selenocysteine lyase